MAKTDIELNIKLVQEAMSLTGMKTKQEVVTYALEELVRHAKGKRILDLEGKVKWEGNLRETRQGRNNVLGE